MGFFSAVKKIFGGSRQDEVAPPSEAVSAQEPEAGAGPAEPEGAPVSPAKPAPEAAVPRAASVPAETPAPAGTSDISEEDEALTLRLREAEPRLSVWLGIILEGVDSAGDLLWQRLAFLLRALDAPQDEVQNFVDDFRAWLERMEYRHVEEFRSELQYRLALALDLEDEEDERSRLFLKISEGLSRTREQFARRYPDILLDSLTLDEMMLMLCRNKQ